MTRIRSARGKFSELMPFLTCRDALLKLKGKIYKACVQCTMVYGSENWQVKAEDMNRLETTERMMIRWMCGVTLKEKIRSVDLLRRLDVMAVSDVVRRGRLRWFGHVERMNADEWVNRCRSLDVHGQRGRGRGRGKKT